MVPASGLERLTPRGEPRQTAVVGVENRSLSDYHCAEHPCHSKEVPRSDPSRRQPLPVNAWRVPADGAFCRPLLGARSPRCQWGREQPPGLDRVSTPTQAWTIAHPPMSVPECSRVLAVICARNARALSRANAPQIPRETRCSCQRSFSPESGHHHDQDRAVLGVVKALAALDPAGFGLDDASAQLEFALM